MTTVQSLLADALAGRYEIEKELGRGGMATVYLAQDLRHKRAVALKVLDPHLSVLVGRERFLREVETAAGLQHPHILPVHDSGDAAGLLWYTMPYVDGESLRDRLRREGRLPIDEAVRIGQEIAGALAAAHRQGVVHRDVKPENVLLSHGQALVADFGIARSTRSGEPTLTETGLSLGTPAYMSPEQALGERDLDGRSDIYALGCLLYELLAGKPPYVASTAQAMISKHLTAPVPDVRRARQEVPAGSAAAIAKAMAKEADARYATAAEFGRALATAISPIDAGRTVDLGKAPARSRSLLATAAGVFVLLAALAAGFWFKRARVKAGAGPVRLAVLPFRNLGDSSGTYLTDGLVDGVRGRLAAMPALRVIASTSTEAYRDVQKPVQQIGRELDVPYLVVGKVRWAKDAAGAPSLQITPELIETSSGVTRWQDPLQARPSDVLEVQTNIATHVAEALGISTPRSSQVTSADSLTRNPEAYDAFLRAQELVRQIQHYTAPDRQFGPAIALYRRALALDSAFALARVRLAYALTLSGRVLGDTTRYREAESQLDAVLRERPKFATALVVQGTLREYQGDRVAAMRLIQEAAALQPNDAAILGELTWRQSVELDSSAVQTGAKAVALAPRDPEMLRTVIAATFLFRHFDTLKRYCDQLIVLDPTDYMGYLNKGLAVAFSRGDTATAVKILQQGEAMAGHLPRPLAWGFAEAGPSGWKRWAGLSLAELGPAVAGDTVDFYFWHSLIENAQGRHRAAQTYADSVIKVVGRAKLLGWRYAVARAQRAYAYALRGDRTSAWRDLAESEARFRDQPVGVREQSQEEFLAAVAQAGDSTRALAIARRLLELPTGVTRYTLRLSPAFARLWGWPEFEKLLADSARPGLPQ